MADLKAGLTRLRAKLEDYRETSQRKAYEQHERRRTKDAYGRSCEAAVLAVCIGEIDALLKGRGTR